MSETEFKWVGTHAQEITGGRMLAPGDTAMLSEDDAQDEHNAALIESGGLVSLAEAAEPQATPAALELAQERSINIATVTGTGSDGRITKEDVEREIAEASDEEGRERS